MVSRFHDKFNEDLELIYAKYSNPFDGAPELTLSTCDLPENVQIIENYKYSNCGKWKVLGADSNGVYDNSCDEGNDDTSDGDNCRTSDEENQSSCYDSDDHSDCSGSFKLGKSFREKYPRLCAKKGSLKTPPFNSKSKKSTDVAKPPPSNHKIHNLAHKQCYYEQEEEQTSSNMALGRHYSSDEYFKPKETVTISKDLWSQVQQCLRLMTSVFRQLNSECDNENDSKKLCNERPSQRQPNSIDTNTSCASVPQGLVVEKLFVRRKGSSRPGVELASRQTFIHDTKNKISEIESLDSGFCQENSNDVDASTQQYSSSSRSRMGGSTSQNTMVSQTSEGTCGESSYLKSSVANSFVKSAAGSKQLSSGVSCHCSDSSPCLQPGPEFLSPKIFGKPNQASSEKKRRRRYRLVRRRSTSCKTRGGSTSETPTSDHESDTRENQHFARNELYPCLSTGTSEHESDTRESHHVARNEHSFDQCLSDTDDFHIPEKTKKTAVKVIKQSGCYSSPETYDVMLVEAPPTPVVHNKVLSPQAIPRNKTPSLTTNCHSSTSHMHPRAISGNKTTLITESSQGYCRSSTPRKHLGVNNVMTSPDSEAYLRQPLFQQHSSTSAESMPSPIRSTLNTNPTETSVNNTFLSNADHPTLSSHKPQNIKESSPSPISSKSPCATLQPEISVNFLRTKDILKRRSSCVTNEGQAEPNIPSGQNNDGYTKKLFPSLSKKGFSASSNTLLSHIPSDDLFKQNAEQDYLVSNKGHSKNNQRGNLMLSDVRSSNSTSTRSPGVQICRTEPFSEPDYGRSKSRRVLCATTNRRLVSCPLTQMHNSESSPTTESSTTHCERKSKVTTPEKLNRLNHNSDRSTSPNNHQLKITQRRTKFHPYATCSTFPRTPSLSSPFQSLRIRSPSLISPLRDLTIKSPSSLRHKWTTLDRSPMAICVKQARRMSDPVVASRKILEFGSHDPCSDFSSDKEKIKSREERESDQITNERSSQYPRKKLTMKRNNKIDCRVQDNESRSNCSTGKCTKTFCFNCSMMDLS